MARVNKELVNQYEIKSLHDYHNPCVVVIDMVNGFVKEGALADLAISDIASNIKTLLEQGVEHVFVADTHKEDALEFQSYPKHCLKDSEESQIMDELKPYASIVLPKNSTCTFMSPAWQDYYFKNQDRFDTFILVGCCSDICILQFALALRAYFNEHQINKRVVVPISMIDTYHIETIHDVELCNTFAISNMAGNAVEIVADFTY